LKGLFSLYGAEGSTNVQGEIVKKLDVISNDALKVSLKRSGIVRVMVTEEEPDPIFVDEASGIIPLLFPLNNKTRSLLRCF
jgi:fructose-1,6-bisphosphatase I